MGNGVNCAARWREEGRTSNVIRHGKTAGQKMFLMQIDCFGSNCWCVDRFLNIYSRVARHRLHGIDVVILFVVTDEGVQALTVCAVILVRSC